MSTRVLGTSFNIQAYGDEAFYEVAVLTGKVSVSAETTTVKELSILTPGQKMIVEKKTGTFGVAFFDNPDQYTAWRAGKLVFENATVQSIARSLGRAFNADIKLRHESLGTCLITTSFDPMTLPEILDLLCLTLNTRYTREGSDYWIEGTQCDEIGQ
jgi:ferric-dicitrate binding protein FerR (iron transport regulator)